MKETSEKINEPTGAEPPTPAPQQKLPFCIESNCKCIMAPFPEQKIIDEGYSVWCIGKAIDIEKTHFKFRDADHTNTHYFCVYTPLKGWIKFMVNRDDIWSIQILIKQLHNVEEWMKCQVCDGTNPIKLYWRKDEKEHICEVCMAAKNTSLELDKVSSERCVICGAFLHRIDSLEKGNCIGCRTEKEERK